MIKKLIAFQSQDFRKKTPFRKKSVKQFMKKKFDIRVNLSIEVENSNLQQLSCLFVQSLGGVFAILLKEVLLYYSSIYKENGSLHKLLNLGEMIILTWKNYEGNCEGSKTTLTTIFGKIWIPQLIVKYKDEKGKIHTKVITRLLLGVSRYQRIPDSIKKLLACPEASHWHQH
jgi:hypothetical protein